jgi:hypothetical protein
MSQQSQQILNNLRASVATALEDYVSNPTGGMLGYLSANPLQGAAYITLVAVLDSAITRILVPAPVAAAPTPGATVPPNANPAPVLSQPVVPATSSAPVGSLAGVNLPPGSTHTLSPTPVANLNEPSPASIGGQ